MARKMAMSDARPLMAGYGGSLTSYRQPATTIFSALLIPAFQAWQFLYHDILFLVKHIFDRSVRGLERGS